MQGDSIQYKVSITTIKIFEILLLTLLISLIGMYVIAENSPEKITSLLVSFLLGTTIMLIMVFVNFATIYRYAYTMYVITNILLILVLTNGDMVAGSTRWISFGDFRFQPAELLKFVLPLVLVKLYQSTDIPLSINSVYRPMIIIAIPISLVLFQPDLDAAIILIALCAFVPFILGLKKKTILATSLLSLCLLPICWIVLLPYQKMRILAYIWPKDYDRFTYQVKHAIYAVQNGGLSGSNKTTFVPAGTTDFIFSLHAHKFGAFGIIILFILFARLIKGIIYLAKSTTNPISSTLIGSYAFLLTSTLLINVLMVLGVLPVVGLPLPLMSFGGTAFIVNIVIISVLVKAFHNHDFQINCIDPDFQKMHHLRLNRLTIFLNIGLWLIIFRLSYIYLN